MNRMFQATAHCRSKIPGVVDVVNQTFLIGPAANFRVDLQKAQLAGFSVQNIADLEGRIPVYRDRVVRVRDVLNTGFSGRLALPVLASVASELIALPYTW